MPNTSIVFQRTSIIPNGVTDEQITRWTGQTDLGYSIAKDMVLHDLRETPYITGIEAISPRTLDLLVNQYLSMSYVLRNARTENLTARGTDNVREELAHIINTTLGTMEYCLSRLEHQTFLHSPIDGERITTRLTNELPMIDVSREIFQMNSAQGGMRPYVYACDYELFADSCGDCCSDFPSHIPSVRGTIVDNVYEYRQRAHSIQDSNGDPVICNDCFEDHWNECDDCGEYVNMDDHSCSSSESVYFTCNTSATHSVGDTTLQFGQRTIGIEFETGSGARNHNFQKAFTSAFPKWGVHEDGSLGDDALEFVTNPLGGHHIQNEVLQFYKMCGDYGVETQDKSAGMHIHIGCSDIYELIGGHQNKTWTEGSANDLVERHIMAGSLESQGSDCPYVRVDSDEVKLINHSDVPEETMVMMGNAFVNIARCFINKTRSLNTYCRSPFGFRDKGSKSEVLKKTNDYTYPAIAMRNLKTMEFRLYPSTTSVNYALARIELSQKLVEYMAINMVKYQYAYAQGITETSMPDVFKLLRLSSVINHANESYPTNMVDKLGDMIGLSTEARTHLQFLYTRSHLKSASSTFEL